MLRLFPPSPSSSSTTPPPSSSTCTSSLGAYPPPSLAPAPSPASKLTCRRCVDDPRDASLARAPPTPCSAARWSADERRCATVCTGDGARLNDANGSGSLEIEPERKGERGTVECTVDWKFHSELTVSMPAREALRPASTRKQASVEPG